LSNSYGFYQISTFLIKPLRFYEIVTFLSNRYVFLSNRYDFYEIVTFLSNCYVFYQIVTLLIKSLRFSRGLLVFLGEIFILPGGVGAKKFSAKKKRGHQLIGKKKSGQAIHMYQNLAKH